jgi:ribosomal protein S24E
VNFSLDIEIIELKENILLHRKEIEFRIAHAGGSSPERIQVRDKIAAMHTAKPELTFIKQMKPIYGLPEVHGISYIYHDEEIASKLEPNYSKIRNMPKDKRTDAWKKIREARRNKKAAAPK